MLSAMQKEKKMKARPPSFITKAVDKKTKAVVSKIKSTTTKVYHNKQRNNKKSQNSMKKKNNFESSSSSSSLKVKSSNPWYTIFTKGDKEYNNYMANEWGYEQRGDVSLFEKISLEGAQSGLSWLTILRKRDAYRRVFHNFDIDTVAAMTQDDVERILQEKEEVYNNDGNKNKQSIIVRHRGKIESVINNAKCIQQLLQKEKNNMITKENDDDDDNHHGIFDKFLWNFVDNKPILNMTWNGNNMKDAISQSPESKAMSYELKKRGFKFVGPTTCYAMMQSIGMVIDHPVSSKEWVSAKQRLEQRPGGYQKR